MTETSSNGKAGAPLLRAVDIHKRYDGLEVLKGISLEVRQGDVVALIGASGSGKTTFLRCINMLEEYQQGEIWLKGEQIGYRGSGAARRRLAESQVNRQRARIGMVFQSFNLFPHMTAEQNVMLGQVRAQGKAKDQARATARAWLDRMGLSAKYDSYPYQLSGGQQQRVAIARAVAMEPELLLFDEVTSALDPELVAEVLSAMRDLAQAGQTMLVVSHEMLFVREVADHVVFMEGGRVAAEGRPEALFQNPSSDRLAAFLGRFHSVFR